MGVQNIVEKYLGSHSHVEQGEQYFYLCPECGSKRFTINYDGNKFRCWKCDYSSKSVIKLLYDLNASYTDISEAKKILGVQEHYKNREDGLQSKIDEILYDDENYTDRKLYKKKSWYPVWKSNSITARRARGYLQKRGVSKYEMKYYDIHFDSGSSMMVFPSYNINGQMNFYVRRNIGDYSYYQNCEGVKKSKIIFWEHLVDFERPIIITEGIFDAIKLGDNSIPLLGSIMTNRLYKLILAFETPKVTIFLDKDAENSMMKMSEKLMRGGITTECVFLEDDIDAGDLHKLDAKKYLNNTTRIDKFELMNQNLRSV